MIRRLAGSFLLCAALGLALAAPHSSAQQPAAPIKIGIIKTFFNDLPQSFIDVAGDVFADAMKGVTGLEGKLFTDDLAFENAEKLDKGQLDIAVFHGHEFAWVQKKYPKLVPLVIATNKHNEVKAYVIVRKDSPAKSLADLRGKKLDVPMGTKQHCAIYLNKHCIDNNQNDPKAYFSAITRSSTFATALDGVCFGTSDAALLDTIGLEIYREAKGPVFEKNLRILQQSESFPSPVVVYKEGALDAATMKKLRDGLLSAQNNQAAQGIIQMWQIKAFEPIPNSYAQNLADTLKLYPSPEPTKVSMR